MVMHDCNLSKLSNIAGRDPETIQITPLLHPRQDRWDDHLEFEGVYLLGKTAVGRTTIYVLNRNSEDQIELRTAKQDF